jgi:flagellar FliJ protein
MTGKRFKLEQVLTYRCEMEKIRRQEFATARHALDRATEQLRQHEDHFASVAREFSARQTELDSVEEIRMYAHFFARKREDIRCQTEQVNHLDQELRDRREHLVNATRDKKVLESLKEKKAREFALLMEQKEQAFLDEISVQKKGLTR